MPLMRHDFYGFGSVAENKAIFISNIPMSCAFDPDPEFK